MTFAEEFATRARALPPGPAVALAVVVNVALLVVGLAAAHAIAHRFRHRPTNAPPEPVTRKELALAALCTTLNTAVFYAGLRLYQWDFLKLAKDTPLRVFGDFLFLFWAMDLAMYVFHRIAHHRWLFPIAHATHHQYTRVRPLSLFALNPLEAIGFGAIWLALLVAHPTAPLAMVLYLTVNTIFGLVGHLGVEFLPKRILRVPLLGSLGTSSFHAQHHLHETVNFGFYTLLWDRLFGTIHKDYEREFPE